MLPAEIAYVLVFVVVAFHAAVVAIVGHFYKDWQWIIIYVVATIVCVNIGKMDIYDPAKFCNLLVMWWMPMGITHTVAWLIAFAKDMHRY